MEISQPHQQIAFYLPEGDFDTQGQEEGQNNGGNVLSSKGGTFGWGVNDNGKMHADSTVKMFLGTFF